MTHYFHVWTRHRYVIACRIPDTTHRNQRSHHVFAAVTNVTGQISTDLTGQFPVTSGRGNKYILVLYDYDGNAILAEPMKNRSDNEHLRAYNKLHQFLVDRGFKPLLQKLDNEASNALKRTIRDKDIDFQLVPPHTHRRNAAERAIQTFKNHFVACLCTADKFFPMRLWDRILPQASTTLNFLRTSRLNPRLSSEAHLNGNLDFNRTPLAPLGTRVIVHETPEKTVLLGHSRTRRMVSGPRSRTLLMLPRVCHLDGR
jgi:hypothetical protein